ncbi:hypothetical protein ACLOJK_033831 [Asimina triloba]
MAGVSMVAHGWVASVRHCRWDLWWLAGQTEKRNGRIFKGCCTIVDSKRTELRRLWLVGADGEDSRQPWPILRKMVERLPLVRLLYLKKMRQRLTDLERSRACRSFKRIGLADRLFAGGGSPAAG